MSNARVLSKAPTSALSMPIGTTYTIGQIASTNHQSSNAATLGFGINDGGGAYSGVFVYNTYSSPYCSQDIRFFTAQGGVSVTTERARITPDGNLLVGTTTSNGTGTTIAAPDSGGVYLVTATTGLRNQIRFVNPNGTVGSIQTNGSSTAYNTSSDYRLKENIAPMQNALSVVQQLKPVTYNWKVDGSKGQGFIAHELAEVVPDCVTGDKDAVDADGKPVYQGIDTSFLVGTLVAAIQELKAEVDSLKAQLETK